MNTLIEGKDFVYNQASRKFRFSVIAEETKTGAVFFNCGNGRKFFRTPEAATQFLSDILAKRPDAKLLIVEAKMKVREKRNYVVQKLK